MKKVREENMMGKELLTRSEYHSTAPLPTFLSLRADVVSRTLAGCLN